MISEMPTFGVTQGDGGGASFVFASISYSGSGQGDWKSMYADKDASAYTEIHKTYYDTGDVVDTSYVNINKTSQLGVTITFKVGGFLALSDGLTQYTAGQSVTLASGATGTPTNWFAWG